MKFVPRRARAARAGRPLWVYLTTLVMIPLVGVAALATVTVRSVLADADSAARAEAAVAAVAQLHAARSAVTHEIIPALSLLVIDDPASAAQLGVPTALVAPLRPAQAELTRQSRAATDHVLAGVPANSTGSAAARDAARNLAALRARVDAHDLQIDALHEQYLAVIDGLTAAQDTVAADAVVERLPVATRAAMSDVQLGADLVTAANRTISDFAGAQLSSPRAAEYREAFEYDWRNYTDAQRRLEALSQPSLRARWRQVGSSAAVTEVDGAIAAYAGADATTRLGLPELVAVVQQAEARGAALTAVLDDAVHQARQLAAADRAHAATQRNVIVGLGLGLLAVSLAGALVLGRSVARNLGVLADAAAEIGRGRLVDVRSGGAREVRTVSAAFGTLVAGLRRIQDQARAVARGDLADPVLTDPLPGPLGQLLHASVEQLVTSLRDREKLQAALAHQAAHDPLTELPNRAQALTLLTAALHRARRAGAMTGLLFVDLDGFKAVNDGHGHACGDEVLRHVARRLCATVRPGDVVCRLGGDEFVVVVEQVGAEADLMTLAERLIAAVREPISAAGQSVQIGASVGIAVCRDAGTDADALIAEADTAAYRAKDRGRGRAELFDESLRAQMAARARMEAAIAEGLATGQMQLHYQPVMDLTTGRLTGYEALVRWHRPGVGMARPDEFIPVAEGSRLICRLDRWVLREATRQLAEWRAEAPVGADSPELTMAVNISGRHLADPSVVSDVADALAASGLPAHLLVVEVTETVLVADPTAFAHLGALREMGVAIAIDDFGTGYTSIGQLGSMPVDTLKIDRSFIASTQHGHPELVALIIHAAHTFGLTVIAEGVEEAEQMDWLRAQLCDQAQGYLLSRPLPAADAAALRLPSMAAGGSSQTR